MGRKINFSYEITNNVIAPFKTGTHKHIENAIAEMGHMLLKSMMFPDVDDLAGHVQILYGCKNTGTYPNFVIGEGAAIYQDPNSDEIEFFYIPSATFTLSGGQTAVAVIVTASYTGNGTLGDHADPVLMSNLVSQDIHDIRTINFIAGSSSSPGYIKDYSSVSFGQPWINIVGSVGLQGSWVAPGSPYGPPRLRLEGPGRSRLELSGVVSGGGSGNPIFILTDPSLIPKYTTTMPLLMQANYPGRLVLQGVSDSAPGTLTPFWTGSGSPQLDISCLIPLD
jgi:hypothetical protein